MATKPQWGKPVPSPKPIGRTPRCSGGGIYERYTTDTRSTLTYDQDPEDAAIADGKRVVGAVAGVAKAVVGDQSITLEALDQRLKKMEAAVFKLAQPYLGGGGQADDNTNQNEVGSKPDDTSPGFAPPAKGRPGITGDAMALRRRGTRTALETINAANQTLRRR